MYSRRIERDENEIRDNTKLFIVNKNNISQSLTKFLTWLLDWKDKLTAMFGQVFHVFNSRAFFAYFSCLLGVTSRLWDIEQGLLYQDAVLIIRLGWLSGETIQYWWFVHCIFFVVFNTHIQKVKYRGLVSHSVTTNEILLLKKHHHGVFRILRIGHWKRLKVLWYY